MQIDARIPVRFGLAASLRDGEAVLTPGAGVHAAGCACCLARSPAAVGLAALFQGRAVGAVPWFIRVLAAPADEAAVHAALRDDPVASVRFRLA